MTSEETDFQFCSLVPNDPNKGFFSPVATDHSPGALEQLTDQSCGEILQLSWNYEQGTFMKTHHEKGLPSILPARSREHREPFTVCNWTPHEERTTSRGDFTPPQTSAPLCGRLLSRQGHSREWHRGESHAHSLPRLRLRPDGLSPVAPGNKQLESSISSRSSLNHDTINGDAKFATLFLLWTLDKFGFDPAMFFFYNSPCDWAVGK